MKICGDMWGCIRMYGDMQGCIRLSFCGCQAWGFGISVFEGLGSHVCSRKVLIEVRFQPAFRVLLERGR